MADKPLFAAPDVGPFAPDVEPATDIPVDHVEGGYTPEDSDLAVKAKARNLERLAQQAARREASGDD